MNQHLCLCATALLLVGCQKSNLLEHARDRYLIMLENGASGSELCAEAKKNARLAPRCAR